MTIRKIAQLDEPVLQRRARELSIEELGTPHTAALIADMIETMRDASGAGLAAPQVYESVRLVVIEVERSAAGGRGGLGEGNARYPGVDSIPLIVLVNPRLTPLVPGAPGELRDEDAISVYEGCLSVTGLRGRVRRPRKVRVEALDASGRPLDFVWEGFRAAVVQHEVDHLDGKLFVDRVDSRTLTFLREYERNVPADLRIVDGKKAVA
jgi:peptide deformylase